MGVSNGGVAVAGFPLGLRMARLLLLILDRLLYSPNPIQSAPSVCIWVDCDCDDYYNDIVFWLP